MMGKLIADLLLISLRVDEPITLFPGTLATDVALRTRCEEVYAHHYHEVY